MEREKQLNGKCVVLMMRYIILPGGFEVEFSPFIDAWDRLKNKTEEGTSWKSGEFDGCVSFDVINK